MQKVGLHTPAGGEQRGLEAAARPGQAPRRPADGTPCGRTPTPWRAMTPRPGGRPIVPRNQDMVPGLCPGRGAAVGLARDDGGTAAGHSCGAGSGVALGTWPWDIHPFPAALALAPSPWPWGSPARSPGVPAREKRGRGGGKSARGPPTCGGLQARKQKRAHTLCIAARVCKPLSRLAFRRNRGVFDFETAPCPHPAPGLAFKRSGDRAKSRLFRVALTQLTEADSRPAGELPCVAAKSHSA